jgi:NAD(P)H-dependent FMN reductase
MPERALHRHTRRDGAAGIGHNYGAAVPDRPVRILLVSGSTRNGSTNTALLRAAVAAAPAGVEASLYEGMTTLPHFNPDDDVDPLPAPVADLRRRIAAADAVLFCTPEYAGALPGTFKNLLDWTVGGPEMYEKPVAWVNAAGLPTRAVKAHESLANVLRTIHAEIVAEACTHIAVPRGVLGADGDIEDPEIRRRIVEVIETLRRSAG